MRRLTVRHKSRHRSRSASNQLSHSKRTDLIQLKLSDYRLQHLWMARHGHLNRTAINAIATKPTTECRDYLHSASSTTKLQQWQYGMMTQNAVVSGLTAYERRCLHTINSRSALSYRLTGQRMSSTRDSNIFNGRRFDGHLCDTSLVDTLLVVNPSLWHVTRRHVIRHQPIVRDATTASTLRPLRYGPSNHRQCKVERSTIAWYRSVNHAVARTTTTTGSTTVNDSSTLPSIPPQQQDIAFITGARHCSASARLAQCRASMQRTHHQRPASPN